VADPDSDAETVDDDVSGERLQAEGPVVPDNADRYRRGEEIARRCRAPSGQDANRDVHASIAAR
jgi:hypothetical protein